MVTAPERVREQLRPLSLRKQVATAAAFRPGASLITPTAATKMALRCLGVKPGDEVIVPDFTYPATADAVAIVGATAVLVDPRDVAAIAAGIEEAAARRDELSRLGLERAAGYTWAAAADATVQVYREAAGQ